MAPHTPDGVVAPAVAARLIDQVLDHAIIALDRTGTIQSWNAGAHQLTGYDAADVVGRSFVILHPHDQGGDGLRLLDTARREGRAAHSGWRRRKDGTAFWGDAVITALREDDEVVGFAKLVRDRTAQHELELSLLRSEERFRLLVREVSDYAIFALDGSGVIESWNAGAERLKGYRPEEALGRSLSIFYTEDDRRAGLPLELLARARAEGKVAHTGWRVRKDGTLFWADVVITALRTDQGEFAGFAKVTRDLTEARRAEDDRRAFYSSFAHDFLTPVSALQGFAGLLRTASPQEGRDYLDRIEQLAERLGSMMSNLVDYAQERVNEAPYLPESIEIVELVETVRGRLGARSDVARVVVTESNGSAHADRGAMERVLTNLIANALAYSEAGAVEIALVGSGDRVRLTVRDHGRGIDPDDLPSIFEEFERGRMAIADGGSGLGLASARHLVEQQGGTISMVSEVGVGTVVTIDLPATGPTSDASAGRGLGAR